MEIKNTKAILKSLSKKMEHIADALECVGEDVGQEEENVFKSIRDTIDFINDFVDEETGKDAERRFEIGGYYYDDECEKIKEVTKITAQSIYLDNTRYELRSSSYDEKTKEYVNARGYFYRA